MRALLILLCVCGFIFGLVWRGIGSLKKSDNKRSSASFTMMLWVSGKIIHWSFCEEEGKSGQAETL